MPKLKKLSLEPWEEAVGIFKDARCDDSNTYLLLGDYRIVFPADCPEASILKNLRKRFLSEKIAVLRTDCTRRPFLFKRLKT